MNSDLPQDISFVALAANETTEFWRWTLEQGVIARRKYLDESQVYDVEFDKFSKQPIETIRSIYEYFSLPFTKELEEKMIEYALENAQGRRFGYHNYNDALYFLNQKSVEVAFEFSPHDAYAPFVDN